MGNMTTAQKWGTGIGAVAGAFGGNPVAGGIIGNTIGGFFGGGDDKIAPRPDYPYMSAEKLYNWSDNYMANNPYDPAKPYEGQLSAPMTGTENQAQNQLTSYMGTAAPSSLEGANKYTTDVLGGGYDPRTSPYYTSMKEQILKDSVEAGDSVRHNAARSGMLHSDPRHIQERKLTENVSGQLAQLLGGVYEAERGRMGQAAGMAPGIAGAMSKDALQKITAGSTIGAMPRQVEQEGLGREYSESMRQLAGAREPLNMLQGLSGKSYEPYNAQSYQPGQDAGGDMSGTLMKLLPLLLSMFSK